MLLNQMEGQFRGRLFESAVIIVELGDMQVDFDWSEESMTLSNFTNGESCYGQNAAPFLFMAKTK